MTIQTNIQSAGILLKSKKAAVAWAVAVLCVIGVAAGLTMQQARAVQARKQTLLRQLAAEQKAKAEQLAKQQERSTVTQGHVDVSELQFKDLSEGYKKSSCSRLENRPGVIVTSAGCNYTLRARGKLRMAVVFVYERGPNEGSLLVSGNAGDERSLAYINTYLQNQAKRYKVSDPPIIEITTYGTYKVNDFVLQKYYRVNGPQILDIFNAAAATNKVPEDQYDMVHYIFLESEYGGMAFPGVHRAFTYNDGAVIPTFIHETLHLFGASDKYNNNDCSTTGTNDPFGRYDNKLPGSDIMCANQDVKTNNINDITAREIGWAN